MPTIEYEGLKLDREKVIAHMEPIYTQARLQKMQRVLDHRTRSIAVGLEGLYDRGNISAVMRSAEAFGLFDVHVVETTERFRVANRVTQGADKWLMTHRWESTPQCVEHLKDQGFKIFTTHLDETARPLDEVSFEGKVALFFGNEKEGASSELLELSDERVILPMQGFVESFNISVAAALCFYHIQKERGEGHGDLSAEQKRDLYARYLLKGHKTQRALGEFEIKSSAGV